MNEFKLFIDGRWQGARGNATYQQIEHMHIGEPTGASAKFYFGMLLS